MKEHGRITPELAVIIFCIAMIAIGIITALGEVQESTSNSRATMEAVKQATVIYEESIATATPTPEVTPTLDNVQIIATVNALLGELE